MRGAGKSTGPCASRRSYFFFLDFFAVFFAAFLFFAIRPPSKWYNVPPGP
jgi:hypothetical protein